MKYLNIFRRGLSVTEDKHGSIINRKFISNKSLEEKSKF